jgi:hypothetical protein
MTGLEAGTSECKQKCLLRTETFCAECTTDVAVSIIDKDVGNRSCNIKIFVGYNTEINVPCTVLSIKLRYYVQDARFVAATLKRTFVAIGEQLAPLITLWCKEKDFVQSATGLALHMVCAKREGTYEIIFKVDVLCHAL